ncbi:MAG: phage/plasmid primase, P4 family [Fuerstiella sp.]
MSRVDRDQVKWRAAGGWSSVILALCPGVNDSHLSGQHGPCPRCGGSDRFRVFDDFANTGGATCNQCFSVSNQDGFAFLQWYNGWTFPRALDAVAKFLGMLDAEGNLVAGDAIPKKFSAATAAAKPRRDPFSQWTAFPGEADDVAVLWAKNRGGMLAEDVAATGGVSGVWNGQRVIGFTGWRGDDLSALQAAALHLYRVDGSVFPAAGKLGERKNHNVGGSRSGWVFVGGLDRFRRAKTVWKVEGLTDGLAVLPLLPADHAVVTLTNGCNWRADSDRMPSVEIFAGKRIVVCGDADVPGQAGAKSFAADCASRFADVAICCLPYPVEEAHGKDLRDWCGEDEWSFSDLELLLQSWEERLVNEAAIFDDGEDVGPQRSFDEFDMTDLGNSEHFAQYSRRLLAFNFTWRKWTAWDGMRWRKEAGERPMLIAKKVVRSMREVAESADERSAKRWVVQSMGSARMTAMVDLAASELPYSHEKLDQDSWAFNCPNGTVDLRTGKLRPHQQADWITKLCPINYEPDAVAPRWQQFLAEVFEGVESVIPFLARWFGYCLSGSIREQKLPVLWGGGANGKSTLLNAVKNVMGNDYTMQAQSDLLIDRKGEQHPTEMADLFGRRMVVCAETEFGRRLAEAKLKALTGGEPVRARRMREDFWEFIPECKLILVTNHRPQVYGTDDGIWRRMLLIPFGQHFGPDRQDPQLMQVLADESPGILAWMIRGCIEWHRTGLMPPEEITKATDEYRDSEDVIGQFTRDRCVTGDDCQVSSAELQAAFIEWAEDNAKPQIRPAKLAMRLAADGYVKFKRSKMFWRGIGLKTIHEDPEGDENGFFNT